MLKTGWELKTLKNISVDFGRGKSKHRPRNDMRLYTDGIYPFIQTGDIRNASHTVFSFSQAYNEFGLSQSKIWPKGTVCITIAANIAETAILDFDACFPDSVIGVVVDENKTSNDYVEYLLQSMKCEIQSKGKGSAQANINMATFENALFPFPCLSEQKRIVAILDEAFANISQAVANAEKNLANARELFDSYLNEVFSQSASQSPSQTLTELTELIVDCEHKTAPTQDSGYPSIRTPNIGKGELLLDGVYRVSEETYKIWTRRAIPKAGDLILAREAPAGNVGVVPQGENVCLGQRTVLIRPKLNIINSEYLAFLMLHPIMQKRLLAGSTGATVQHVNVKDIRALGFGTLPSKTFQNEVVHKIKAAKSYSESLEDIYRRKLAALAELKQALLQKAFTGEL